MPADLSCLAARRLRRRAPSRLRRRSSRPATAPVASSLFAEQRVPAPFGDAADLFFVAADSCFEFGRVASRPGYPAEPAARSWPFGRVSLAPPLASLAARSACPAARCAHRRLPSRRRRVRRGRPGASAFANGALLAPLRGPSAQSPRRLPTGSNSGTGPPTFGTLGPVLSRPSAARLSHPTHL